MSGGFETGSDNMPLQPSGPATLETVLQVLSAHRAESRVRWKHIADRLDDHAAQLRALPGMKSELEQNTAITKQYAEDQAFKKGMNTRVKVAAIWAAAAGSLLGGAYTIKQFFGGGPPPGMGPQ